jgi:cellulose 1,4-beta-cellobiosidase
LTSLPRSAASSSSPKADANPYLGVEPHVNKGYATRLEETIADFESQNDSLKAARTRTVQKVPTFAWVSNSAAVRAILA